MDLATVIGLVLAGAAILGSILAGGSISYFIDIPSVLVVGGGVIAVTLVKWSMEDVVGLVKVFMKSIFSTPLDAQKMIGEIEELAQAARRDSIFALEKIPIENEFLKKAVLMAADNRPPEVISATLKLEVSSLEERHKKGIEIMKGIGADGPAFGMIGTLIGLVLMLQNMSDPSAIGPAMAVALLTTFYGAVIANAIAIPVSNKLTIRSAEEATVMNIIIAGVLGIVAGENPKIIRGKLDSFLPPDQRKVEDAE